MPTSLPSPHFSLRLEGLHDFKVLAFSGREAIGQPYRFELELVSERPDLDLQALLQQPAFLAFGPDGSGVHGLVDAIAQGESGQRLIRYTLALVPQLAYLAHRTNARIFQQRTVPEILVQLLEEHGIQADAYRFQLGPTVYPARAYCVQYAETDLHFLQRLCEEEGLHYHFQHSEQGHVLVFGDDQSVFPKLAGPTPYLPDAGAVTTAPTIKRFGARLATRPNQVSLRTYDFEQPHLTLENSASQASAPALEDYAYPAPFNDRGHGRHLAQRALERHRHDHQRAEGHSDQPLLRAGQFLDLGEHPRPDWNQLWLLGEVVHEGKQPQALEELGGGDATLGASGADGFTQGYRNRFVATPWDQVFRLPLRHAKPRLLGSQSAVVTGPAGEEIHCDEYGRIKVQFHWDRDGQGDDSSSCWLRVASGWAGDRYGALAIPRVGMEVLVSFLDGDPDQPLVTGCLYHKTHPVPYDLPAHKTRSVFKTLSSPGGGGGNELRIEDRKDAEQIYLHAQRDWDQQVNHDYTVQVGHQRHETVAANSYSELKAEEHRITHGNRLAELKADDHLTVHGSQHVKLARGQFVEAGQEIHLSSGQKIVMEAGSELTLKVGGSFVKLDASGVTLVGAQVKINSGGSAGVGSGVQVLAPTPLGTSSPAPAGKAPRPTAHQTSPASSPEPTPVPAVARIPAPQNICLECWRKALQEGQPMLVGG